MLIRCTRSQTHPDLTLGLRPTDLSVRRAGGPSSADDFQIIRLTSPRQSANASRQNCSASRQPMRPPATRPATARGPAGGRADAGQVQGPRMLGGFKSLAAPMPACAPSPAPLGWTSPVARQPPGELPALLCASDGDHGLAVRRRRRHKRADSPASSCASPASPFGPGASPAQGADLCRSRAVPRPTPSTPPPRQRTPGRILVAEHHQVTPTIP